MDGRGQSLTYRHTIATQFSLFGVGLHSGVTTTVRVLPAPGKGRYFVRVDLPQMPVIPATVAFVTNTVLSTQLGEKEAGVRTVEHLLAALAGMGVDDARIEIDGAEVPLLDGSAQRWVEEIAAVGLVASSPRRSLPLLLQPIWVRDRDAFVIALPASATRFTYGIDFDEVPAIGNQWHSWAVGQLREDSFARAIAPARTFGLAHQIEALQQQGLIKGGSLDNALVCDRVTGWLNPPLRFAKEPVRHKILDLVGDLSLVKNLPVAHYLAYKASHNLHIQLARLLEQKVIDEDKNIEYFTPTFEPSALKKLPQTLDQKPPLQIKSSFNCTKFLTLMKTALTNPGSMAESASPVVDETTLKTVFTVEEIQKLLPHRYPFALVDRIIEYVPGKRAVGIKNVTFNEPHFQGHFPGRPMMPGVLIVEAMAQVGGIVLTQLPELEGGLFLFAGIDKVRFRRPVVPGDRLIMTVELLCVKRRRFGKMQARTVVDGQLVSEGELMFSLVD